MMMTIVGRILAAVAAVVLAYANGKIASEVRAWLHTLQASVESRDVLLPGGSRGDVVFTGRDRAFERTISSTGWLARAGWLVFATGTLLQVIGPLAERAR